MMDCMLGGGKEICLVGTIVWMMVSFIIMGNRLEMEGGIKYSVVRHECFLFSQTSKNK